MGINNKFIDCPKIIKFDNYIIDDFKNESELSNYINQFAFLFARDVLEIKYKSHKREYYLGVDKYKANLPHVDFMFESNVNEKILVECKNIKYNKSSLINSIGQLLAYNCIAEENGIKISRLCIIVNKFDNRLRMIISKFALPIELYIFNKSYILKLMN